MTRLEHIDFEVLFVAAEGDPGREIQAALEDRNLESRGDHNVLAAIRIEQRGIVRTDWICHRHRRAYAVVGSASGATPIPAKSSAAATAVSLGWYEIRRLDVAESLFIVNSSCVWRCAIT
jgi:hypothetical protein